MPKEEKSAAQAAPPPMPAELLPQIVASPQIPKLYMQSFANFASAIDITVVVLNCSTPNGVITMSYETAKSLVHRLGQALETYEKVVGRPILNTDEVQSKLIAVEKHD
jgi:hypothetical protein